MNHSIEALLQQALSGLETLPIVYQLLFFYVMAFLQIAFGLPGDIALMLGSFVGSVVALPGGSWTVFASYFLGTCTGGLVMFEVGRRGGARILSVPWVNKLLSKQHIEGARRFADRHGKFVFLFTKFIPGINGITLLIGGALHWRRISSYLCIFIAAFGHNLLLFLVGRTIGNNLDAIAAFLAEYSRLAIIGICILVMAMIILIIMKNRKKLTDPPGDQS